MATSNIDEKEIFIWNLNNIRKNKNYGETVADIPDKTLLIGEEWRVVNFKWLNNNSNSILVSVKHETDQNRFKLIEFNVGTCDHFQMSKVTKQMDINPIRETCYNFMIEDFNFMVGDNRKIFIIGEKKQAQINLENGKEMFIFKTQSSNENEKEKKEEKKKKKKKKKRKKDLKKIKRMKLKKKNMSNM